MMIDMQQTTPQWLWWWFRFGIGLAAAAAGGALLVFLLWRRGKGGRWGGLPKEERERKKAEKEHLLTRVSGRGRTAYLVLCLENALIRFGLPAADWEWVLQRLWALTEAPESQHRRLFEVCCLLPENVLPYESYEELTAQGCSSPCGTCTRRRAGGCASWPLCSPPCIRPPPSPGPLPAGTNGRPWSWSGIRRP